MIYAQSWCHRWSLESYMVLQVLVIRIVLWLPILHNSPYSAAGYFSQFKIMQKNNWKMTETLAYRYSSESTRQEPSNEYQHDRGLET